MDPLVPEWRTLGGEAAAPRSAVPAARPRLVVPVHVTRGSIALIACGILGLGVAVVAVLLTLMPSRPGVVFDVQDLTGTGAPAPLVAGVAGDTLAGTGRALEAGAGPRLVVDVEGAVQHPGLIAVPAGSRIGDALRLAGGFAPNADLRAASASLNLAELLGDGAKIIVPELGGTSRGEATGPSRTAAPGAVPLVDLNTASQTELETLPGIGPVTAGKIVAARAEQLFARVDELRSRNVLGSATFENLRDLVTASR
jgi:competence protein ComEA